MLGLGGVASRLRMRYPTVDVVARVDSTGRCNTLVKHLSTGFVPQGFSGQSA